MDVTKKVKKEDYQKYVSDKMPKSKTFTDCLKAFFVGGAICCVGQTISLLASDVLMLSEKDAGAFTSAAMIFLGALLTGLGIYDVIGNFAGAGSIVPITGFANSIVSPAMEFKREGLVLGLGAKLFVIAGPVLVYGITSATTVGLIYYIVKAVGLF